MEIHYSVTPTTKDVSGRCVFFKVPYPKVKNRTLLLRLHCSDSLCVSLFVCHQAISHKHRYLVRQLSFAHIYMYSCYRCYYIFTFCIQRVNLKILIYPIFYLVVKKIFKYYTYTNKHSNKIISNVKVIIVVIKKMRW